ncbi:hypothetical protein SBOR_2737 [Sclerotinia borealis F-4128]|uniref:Uncharacterized protein n=1 Tax=Sclerotinia borealis (strain F-4128) TaxID=1432307 RepID=W9CJE6_SCLBF|nr:hypothetical protein SBOR_2737 [Sclerotinia borealis F-4128]
MSNQNNSSLVAIGPITNHISIQSEQAQVPATMQSVYTGAATISVGTAIISEHTPQRNGPTANFAIQFKERSGDNFTYIPEAT